MRVWHAPHNVYHWFAILALFTVAMGGVPVVWENLRSGRNLLLDLCLCGFLMLAGYAFWMHS